jgi:hypothetical protein
VRAPPSLFDLFVHDRTTGFTSRVNISSTGEQAGARSFSSDQRCAFRHRVAGVFYSQRTTSLGVPAVHRFRYDKLTDQLPTCPFCGRTSRTVVFIDDLVSISADERVRAYQLCSRSPVGKGPFRLPVRRDRRDAR